MKAVVQRVKEANLKVDGKLISQIPFGLVVFFGVKTGDTKAQADYLVKKGVPFRDAHGIIGRLVLYCIDKNTSIDALSIEELKEITSEIKKHNKVGVVIQTTQKLELLQEVSNYLIPLASELKVFNTICKSTSKRQQEARELAKKSDLMIVVGSKKSANTTHLAEILSEITKTIHIETQKDLLNHKDSIDKAQNIGVTAGASTPDDIINDVIKEIEKI